MRDKTHFSFLIAFARQLEAALTSDVDDDVADSVDSLGASLVGLLAIAGGDTGEDLGGDAQGSDGELPDGDATPLGAAAEASVAERLARLEQRAAATVDVTPRRRVGGASRTGERLGVGRKRHRAPVLKGAKRHGKK